MPWDSRDHPESSDLKIRLLHEEYARNREKVPGLMIFRKAAPKSVCDARAPLFVFVVGETPTGGINKRQFFNALRIMQDIRGSSHSSKSLYIMGPTFSGSLYPLMFLLAQIPKDSFPHTVIHSGTVNSGAMIKWFKEDFEYQDKPKFKFRTFQESDCYALARFIAFLGGELHEARDVALLSEDETAYGEQGCSQSDVVQLYFPREISGLRSAFQHDVQSEEYFVNGGKRPRSTLRSNLEDNGNDDDSVPSYSRVQTPLSEEAILMGIVSSLQKHHSQFVVIRATNPLDALFLGRYLRNAYPEGRIVTMDADLRFQREMEDAKLRGILAITPYSLRPGADDQLAMLGVSEPSNGSKLSNVDRIFPASQSEGTYNAMLSLLKCDPSDGRSANAAVQGNSSTTANPPTDEQMSCKELPVARYAGYGWPDLARDALPHGVSSIDLKPPLWLMALGRNGYWPVALLNDPVSAQPTTGPASVLESLPASLNLKKDIKNAPLPWKTLFWLGIAIAMTFLFLMWKGSLLSVSDTSANFAPFNVPSRNLVFFLLDLLLLLMLLPLSWPWFRWFPRFFHSSWLFWILLAMAAVVFVGFKDLRRRGARKLAWSFLVLSILAFVISTWIVRSGPPLTENFMLYRYIHITSGISPLVPLLLLLAAGLWCTWYTLAGLALLDKRKPLLPGKEDLSQNSGPGKNDSRTQAVLNQVSWEENRILTRVMKPNSWDLRLFTPPAVFLLLSATAIEIRHPVKSLEGWIFDVAYAWLLGLIIFVLLLGLARLAVIWLEFRNLLTRLDQFPLRRGFERLEGFTWKPIWQMGDSALRGSDRLIRRQFESLDHLWNRGIHDPELKGAVEKAREQRNQVETNRQQEKEKEEAHKLKELKKKKGSLIVNFLADLFEPQPQWVGSWVNDLEKLQKQLAATCGAALKHLSQVWDQERELHMHEASRRSGDKKMPTESHETIETQLTEQFVCLFYLNFILSVIFRMRTLVVTAGGMFVLALFSFSSYPFEPRSSFHVLMVILFLLVIGVVGVVLAEMHRNATLSRITDTLPGELGIDFWFRLASFVALPLLTILATQFPEINNALFSWLEPALQALK